MKPKITSEQMLAEIERIITIYRKYKAEGISPEERLRARESSIQQLRKLDVPLGAAVRWIDSKR